MAWFVTWLVASMMTRAVTWFVTRLVIRMMTRAVTWFVTRLVTRAVDATTWSTLDVTSSAPWLRHDRPNKKADARRIDAIPPELLGKKERL